MKQTERTNNHVFFRLLLFALVMLLPLGAWGQTGYRVSIGTENGDITRVTSENATAITGPGITGTVTYDAVNNVLTLNDATIIGTIYSYGDLTIELTGDNFVTANDSSAIKNTKMGADSRSLTFKGTGRLMAKPKSASCVDGFDNPTYEDGQSLLLGELFLASVVGTQLFSGGAGTSADTPYLISTVADLKNLALYVNEGLVDGKFFKLQNDIDCSTMTGFVPIGSNKPFIGTFNGNDKTISGLSYSTTNTNDIVGLFAMVGTESDPTGTIENLVLEDCSFSGKYISGGIVGLMNNGTLQNCKVTGNSTISAVGDGAVAGAIIGNYSGGALIGNYYYYSVTTSTQGPNDSEPVVKNGHNERGIGNRDDIIPDNGVVLYTKELTITGLGSDCTREGDPGYDPLNDYDNFIFHYAPGATATLYLYPNANLVPSVTLSYIETGETEPTIVPLEKDPNEDGYVYSFTMPDVDATFAITLAQGYSLYIGNTQVTSANKDDVLGDGKVSFSVGGDVAVIYTLTLNGATITAPIKVGLANLIFDIQGNNTITTSETCIQKMENTNPSLTFKSTSDIVGSLNLKNDNGGIFSDDLYGKITINEEFAMILQYYDKIYSNTYYLTNGMTYEVKLAPSYGVTVGGMQIYEGNAADVTGDGIGDGAQSGMVSFNKETSTLTLTNASLSGIIRSSLPNLTIDLVGDNSIYSGGDRILQAGVAVNMTITSSEMAKGCLNMRKGYSSSEKGNFVDGNVNLIIDAPLSVISGSLTNDNDANDYYATIGVSYGITITAASGSYPITNVNRKNVLNDSQGEETVQFDGIKTLMLNGATLQSINIANQHELQELVIYLKGNNTINNNDNNGIIYGGDPNLPLTYATGDGSTTALQPGTLECSYYVQDAEHPEVMNIYDNFSSVTYNNNLSENQNTTDHKIKVDVALTPIITKEQPEVTNEGDAGKGIGEDIQQYIAAHPELNTTEKVTAAFKDGVTIKNILYILASDDGRDETDITTNVLNLNTKMDDATASVLASDLKDSGVSPSSDYFTSKFKGLCFLLPAGSGEIKLNLRTNEYGEVHVMIGSGAAIPISTEIYQDYTIGYSVTEDTYVLIYSVADPKSSSRPFAAPRAPGRKMTTTTQIKSVGVRASRVSSAPEPPLSPKSLSKSDITLSNGSYVSIKNVKIDDAEAGNVAEMDDDVFEDIKTNDTPLTYVDLSQTALTGLTVDRTNLPWKNLPATTFIYLPVGNKAKADEKNVIIGSVSDDVEFMETGAFETPMDFTATKATLKRDFSEKIGKKCSIFLPFALDEETAAELGTFYQMAPVSAQIEGKIVMETVEKTVANVPYMFKPAKEAISVNMVEVLKTIPAPTAVKDVFFEGTFEEKTVMSDSDFDVYCFMGDQFVRVKDDPVTLSPFRSYMYKVASSSLSNELDIDWGDGTTSIKNMKVGINDNIYYDLQGRRVLYPQKGIYIVNGKKVILK